MYESLSVVIRDAAEMDASCAVSQGSVACGLTGADADTLNVEHELSRWLRDLDSSVSRPSGFPVILYDYHVFHLHSPKLCLVRSDGYRWGQRQHSTP